MKVKPKVISRVVNNYINEVTGEILDVDTTIKKEYVVVDTKEEFFTVYASFIKGLHSLSPSATKLMLWAALNCTLNTNRITFVKKIIEEVSEELNMGQSTVRNSIKELVKKELFISEGSGLYIIDPKYYWKGDKTKRTSQLKYVFELKCPECSNDIEDITY